MYGTNSRMQLKPCKFDELKAIMSDCADNDDVAGMRSVWVYRSDADPNEHWVAVSFESKAAYVANAESAGRHERFLPEPARHPLRLCVNCLTRP